jgi:hypothetical protein
MSARSDEHRDAIANNEGVRTINLESPPPDELDAVGLKWPDVLQ